MKPNEGDSNVDIADLNGMTFQERTRTERQKNLNSSATFLQQFLVNEGQNFRETLQKVVGRLGLEPRAT